MSSISKPAAGVPDNAKQAPVAYLRQMAAYVPPLEKIFPDRPDQGGAALLTRGGKVWKLSHELVRAAPTPGF